MNTSSCSAGDRPADGSSSSSTDGSIISARPMASIWRSPPDSEPARWSARSTSRGNISPTTSNRSRNVFGLQEDAHLEVLADRQRREHVVVLRDVADAAAHERVRLQVGDVLAAQADAALRGC